MKQMENENGKCSKDSSIQGDASLISSNERFTITVKHVIIMDTEPGLTIILLKSQMYNGKKQHPSTGN